MCWAFVSLRVSSSQTVFLRAKVIDFILTDCSFSQRKRQSRPEAEFFGKGPGVFQSSQRTPYITLMALMGSFELFVVAWSKCARYDDRAPPWAVWWINSRWWFQRFFIFTPIWGNDPIWLMFFRWVVQPPTRITLDYISCHCEVFFANHGGRSLFWVAWASALSMDICPQLIGVGEQHIEQRICALKPCTFFNLRSLSNVHRPLCLVLR